MDQPEPATTYSTPKDACAACMTNFPKVRKKDLLGGTWTEICHVGQCTGTTAASSKESYCITLAPVAWYTPCEELFPTEINTMNDVLAFCSYQEQMLIPEFSLLGFKDASCSAIITDQGHNLFSDLSSCDTDQPLLHQCCESVYRGLTCVVKVATDRNVPTLDTPGVEAYKVSIRDITHRFATYCQPLCQFTKDEFCSAYPLADPCSNKETCFECVARGGEWCAETGECVCGVKECFTIHRTAAECGGGEGGIVVQTAKPTITSAPPSGSGTGAGDLEGISCKYANISKMWKD